MAREFYQFPRGQDEDLYKGRITFEAENHDYQRLAEAGANFIQNIPTQAGEAIGITNSNQSSRSISEAASRRLQVESSLAADELNEWRGNTPTTRSRTGATPTISKVGKVQLYLPPTIQFSDAVEYQNIDLGILGSAAEGAIRSGMNAAELAGAVAGKLLPDGSSVMDAIENGFKSEAAQVAGLRVARRLSSEVQGAISTTTGVALNPNTRSKLRGPGIREFRFTFQMAPKSETEALEIQRIIKFFRENMYPEVSDIIALKYPPKWNIKMAYNGRSVATGILPSFLKGCDVTYNPNGMAFHRNAHFQQTDMTLTFVEERTLSKTDINANY